MRVYSFSFILICLNVFGQIIEDFSDGEFENNPNWYGDTSKFIVINQSLRSNSEVENSFFQLNCSNKGPVEEWQFNLELKFKTSSANYTDLIFYSDSTEEYFIRLGGTDDAISLWHSSVQSVKLKTGIQDITENSRLSVKIIRDSDSSYAWFYAHTDSLKFHKLGSFQLKPKLNFEIGWRIRQSTASFFYKHQLSRVYAGPRRYDTIGPSLDSTILLSNRRIKLVFNESLEKNDQEFIALDDSLLVDSFIVEGANVHLYFPNNILNGQHKLKLAKFTDTANNSMKDTVLSFNSFFPDIPIAADIIFNELLFNPPLNGVDFIELYNKSDKYFDLSEFHFIRWRNNSIDYNKALCTNSQILKPHSYVAISPDSTILCSDYNCALSQKIINAVLPPMNNDIGTITLVYYGLTVDSISYSEDWHLSLLPSVDGVSLERIVLSGESNSPNNWQSASETAGYATPAYRNSQSIDRIFHSNMALQYENLSPNGDAYQDFLILNYQFDSPNNILNAYIYSLNGLVVHQWANTLLLNTQGSLKWDLVLNDGTLIANSKYIVYLEVFNTQGKVLRKKLPFSVVSQY